MPDNTTKRYSVSLLYGMTNTLTQNSKEEETTIAAKSLRAAKQKATQWAQGFGINIKQSWHQKCKWDPVLKKAIKINQYGKWDDSNIVHCTTALQLTPID